LAATSRKLRKYSVFIRAHIESFDRSYHKISLYL